MQDPDAAAYINAVQAADGQSLEYGVCIAIHNFVKSCKSDGIWDAIKSSCILAGARTLNGALVPLKGTAPTNFNFVSSDYSRDFGLKGNGTSKYLNTNRNVNTDPQNNFHQSIMTSSIQTINASPIGAGGTDTGSSQINYNPTNRTLDFRNRNSLPASPQRITNFPIGFIGHSRNSSSSYVTRAESTNSTITQNSQTPYNGLNLVFARNFGTVGLYSNVGLKFYSIGEALDLEKLDNRVSILINQITLAIRGLLDVDALNYIRNVEFADGQPLEINTYQTINSFVTGCKSDGIWDAIKSSCILAGARTLNGALVPLKGVAPTNFNFVSGDYNRKTGLVGNGSTKYLNSNRNNNADPQDSRHVSIYASTISTGSFPAYFGGDAVSGGTQLIDLTATTRMSYRLNSASAALVGLVPSIGFIGINRSSSSDTAIRNSGITTVSSNASASPTSFNLLFYRRTNLTGSNYNNGRFAFYSIGESLDLEKLDNRISLLMSGFNSSIP
jgi:hypothetical protein